MGSSERRKGVVWEQTVARWLRDRGYRVRRTGVAGQQDGDLVVDNLPYQLECKNQKDQTAAIRDGLGQLTGPGVVVVKRRGKGPGDALAVMTLSDWLDAHETVRD